MTQYRAPFVKAIQYIDEFISVRNELFSPMQSEQRTCTYDVIIMLGECSNIQ